MGKVIKFPVQDAADPKNADLDGSEFDEMIRIADQIDAVVLEHLRNGLDAKELAGILAHRLGTLMRTMDEKDKLFDVCKKVLKKQAAID